ncbi:MAG TPA: hypothetical protein VE263_18040 [Candidatus Angelobacter sp.]|nr:hypothetical protein [Candidatus Angelobacter sp.]
MNASVANLNAVFLSDVAVTALLLIGIILYMHRHLRALLIELCGTAERANFWLALSNVTMLLVPLIFALDYKPEFGPHTTVLFEMATQLKYALIGLVTTLGLLAFVLFRFLPRDKGSVSNPVPR